MEQAKAKVPVFEAVRETKEAIDSGSPLLARLLAVLQEAQVHLTPGTEFAILREADGSYALANRSSSTFYWDAPEPMETAKKPSAHPGYVYMLRADNGLYKIGKTKQLDKRIYICGVKLPYKVELIASYFTPDMTAGELHWHDHFAAKRVNGEWFRLDDSDVALFGESA